MFHIKLIDTKKPSTKPANPLVILAADAVATVVGSEPGVDVMVVEPLVITTGVVTVAGVLGVVSAAVEDATSVDDAAPPPPVVEEDSPAAAVVVVSTAVVEVAPVAAGVVAGAGVVSCSGVVTTVVGTSPPLSAGIAYGGSKSPKRPHALQGRAQERTASGATRLGSHRPSGDLVAITDGSSDCGQSVPRSDRVSCRVAEGPPPGTRVDISVRSRAKTGLEAAGP